jgi:hypothetical protein
MFTKARWDKSFIFNSIRLRREWLLLQQGMTAAVATLRQLMLAADTLPWLKAQCARDILTLGLRSWELYNQEERIKALEIKVARYAEQQTQAVNGH